MNKSQNNKKKINPNKRIEKTNTKTSNQKKSNLIKLNSDFESQNFVNIKKLRNIFIVIVLIFVLLIGRIAYIQFFEGSYLKSLAYRQQNINQIISPKRGSIYDSTGMLLATSATVDTITINPTRIKDSKDNSKTQELKEKVAKALSDIFELDYEETLKKVTSSSQVETIAKKVEQEKVDSLKTWMKDNKVSVGINIDEDTKRYYPYGSFLSHVLGSYGEDKGMSGIENEWDSVLSGTPGKIVSSKGGSQEEIPNAEETYIAAENGNDLTLSINFNVQSIVEKYLKQAVENYSCENGGSCIVMNPKNGDILAMATYPNYDLNTPFTPNETVSKTYDSLSSEEKANAIYKMWSNKSVSELYEPGSVFKTITASVALEENITDTDIDGDFTCKGYENVSGVNINCWRHYNPHGSQSLRRALMNSCNPAFIQLASRIGTSTLYKYYKAFGLFDKTGIDLPGEANSMFTDEQKVGPVERATMSFGQRFSITPLQMITAVSAIANDGVLIKPRIVKQITNTDTGTITNIDTTVVRQVISKETSQKVKSMMESVVTKGTGGRGAVAGYSIGGKTGTSEPIAGKEDTDGYVASYVAISPIEDTQVVLLLTLYKPDKKNHQGGQVAGPVVSQMLTEILPCLGIPSNDNASNDNSNLVTVPDVRTKTIAEAEKILKSAGFTSKITTSNDKNSTTVIDQVPKPGVSLSKNSIIMLYDQSVRTTTTVPDLTGMSASQATSELRNLNLNISITGSGTVVSQDPPKASKVDEGTVVKVTLKSATADVH